MRRQFRQRKQDEGPGSHPGMGKRRLARPTCSDSAAIVDKVQIDEPRRVRYRTDSPKFILDGMQLCEQGVGVEIRGNLGHCVYVPRLA